MAMAHAGFAFLAMPKTGSTSLEAAFYEHAQVTTRRPPPMKHMTARTFTQRIVPLLAGYGFAREDYLLLSVVREPVDWVESWYRYRTRIGARGSAAFAGAMSFSEFAAGVVEGTTRLGSATRFVSAGDGRRLVDHVVRYEHLGELGRWMAEQLGVPTPDLPRLNVSPDREVDLDPGVRRRLEEFLADDVALYESAGGAPG